MKVCQINPKTYSSHKFTFSTLKNDYKKINSLKTQYVYRFLIIQSGQVKVEINGNEFSCQKGDVIYLIPGDFYRLIPCGYDFSLYNVFFDYFYKEDFQLGTFACVYDQAFDKNKCSQKIVFDDALILNQSGVFSLPTCLDLFEHNGSESSLEYGKELFFKLRIMKVVHSIITLNCLTDRRKEDKVEEILRYIKENPTKDLCAKNLEDMFGYHRNYINQMIKEKTGQSLSKHIKGSKMKYAKKLMLEMGYTPTETAWTLGYYDYSHFYKAFLQEEGRAPSQFVEK